jgi:GNAT superfamily N-acetyltransferase
MFSQILNPSLKAPIQPCSRNRLPEGWCVRVRQRQDYDGIRFLMRSVYSPPHGMECVWSVGSSRQHLEIFPEGKFVVVDEAGTIRGTSTTLCVSRDKALHPRTWLDITGNGTLRTHDPHGKVLYGVDIAVDPSCQGRGIGRALYHARFTLARTLGCSLFAAGTRIPGFRRYAEQLQPQEYVTRVVEGRIFDPTLTKQLALGFRVVGVLLDYAYDCETHGHAALIVKDL